MLTGTRVVQAGGLCLLVAALTYLVVWSADSWADWVVLGVVAVTVFGAAVAIYPRAFPTGKPSFTRSSEDRRR
jgi:hypothetical protein